MLSYGCVARATRVGSVVVVHVSFSRTPDSGKPRLIFLKHWRGPEMYAHKSDRTIFYSPLNVPQSETIDISLHFVSLTRQICGTHPSVACRRHTVQCNARAGRSVRIPCNQTESFPPRATSDEAARQTEQSKTNQPHHPAALAHRRRRGARRRHGAVAACGRGAHGERVAARHRHRGPANRRQVRRTDGRVRLGLRAESRTCDLQRFHGRARPGHWLDDKTWVYDFENDLPPGVRCSVALNDTLRSVAGNAASGPRRFTFQTGGPFPVNVRPARARSRSGRCSC